MRTIFISIVIFFSCALSGSHIHASSIETIGVIYSADIQHYRMIQSSVIKNLKRRGVDTNHIRFVEQRPYPNIVSWANAVRKLIAYDSKIIIAYGSGAAKEALLETSSIPVVYGAVYGEPPEIKKKKNSHGCSYRISMTSFLRYLRKAKEMKDIAMVYSPFEIDSMMQFESLKQICDELGIRLIGIAAKTFHDIEMMLKLRQFDALFISGSSLANVEIEGISKICMKKNIPVVSLFEGTEKYAFLTITSDVELEGREMAGIVFRLLNGNNPNTIRDSVVTRTKIYFNLKLTTELNLKIPIELVTAADKMIR